MPSELDRVLKVAVYAAGKRLDLEGYDVFLDGVESYSSREPNTATVTVHNLGRGNRDLISNEHQGLEIIGGYGQPGMLFSGDTYRITHVPPQSNKVGWETRIEAGDGRLAIRDSWVSRTWGAGTPLTVVLGDIFAQMSLAYDARVSGALRDSWAYNGTAADAASELCWDYGLQWAVYNGVAEARPADEPVDTSTALAVDLSSETGMIGSPQIQEVKKKGGQRRFELSIKSLLNPNIRPNGLVRVTSAVTGGLERNKKGRTYSTPGANGVYRVKYVNHYGTKYARDFYTDAQAEILI